MAVTLKPQTLPPLDPEFVIWANATITDATGTYLALGGTNSTFRWYKLVDGAWVQQTAPTVMPAGAEIYSVDWVTNIWGTYLAVGSQEFTRTGLKWYKLVAGLLVNQTAPTTMPANQIRCVKWHLAANSMTYLAVASNAYAPNPDGTWRFVWYRMTASGTLTVQTAPTTMPGDAVQSCDWVNVAGSTYLAVAGHGSSNGPNRFVWYKLTAVGTLTHQTAPTTLPGVFLATVAWGSVNGRTLLVVGGQTNDNKQLTIYELVSGALTILTAPVDKLNDTIQCAAWFSGPAEGQLFLAVGAWTTLNVSFMLYEFVDGVLNKVDLANPPAIPIPRHISWGEYLIVSGGHTNELYPGDLAMYAWVNALEFAMKVNVGGVAKQVLAIKVNVEGVAKNGIAAQVNH